MQPLAPEIVNPVAARYQRLERLAEKAWRRVEEIIDSDFITYTAPQVQVSACDQVLKRTDPVPKDAVQITTQGPTLIVWDLSAQPTPPRSGSDRMALSATSSTNSPVNGFPSWSAIEDGGKPPSP